MVKKLILPVSEHAHLHQMKSTGAPGALWWTLLGCEQVSKAAIKFFRQNVVCSGVCFGQIKRT